MRGTHARRTGGRGLLLPSVLVALVLATEASLIWTLMTGARPLTDNLGLLLAMAGMLALAVVGGLMVRDARLRLDHEARENARNEAAILRLLDEIGDLADGDLRIEASVTESFTGAIADSINFAVDQMRGLVADINELSVQVAQAADESRGTAHSLAQSSEHQAREVAGASSAIDEMAASIDQVSAHAQESTEVAERAVSIAGNGAGLVRNTINGMERVRAQIQETSKLLKRLGESSQEIGDIVSLIDDIADQTNILSLNAAIQASMAGDAGRGFAVVADEVQRLSERAGGATRRISSLVKTIQTDTNEAVASMEQTTSEVVQGAQLAQDAGVALEEIEAVSTDLASLIRNISSEAHQQAASAGRISSNMTVIREITQSTSQSTDATARSIGDLAAMAAEMRRSVEGFKLPESPPDGRGTTMRRFPDTAGAGSETPASGDDGGAAARAVGA